MIERVDHNDQIIAIVIRADYSAGGIQFFTPNRFSQQLGYMSRPKGYKIAPHIHNKVKREVVYTQEVLIVRDGKVKVNLYSQGKDFLESKVLEKGDVILLASGGHSLEMLEDTEIFEVKQGPYAGDNDKTRFDSKK